MNLPSKPLRVRRWRFKERYIREHHLGPVSREAARRKARLEYAMYYGLPLHTVPQESRPFGGEGARFKHGLAPLPEWVRHD